jgi:hypothetical protein
VKTYADKGVWNFDQLDFMFSFLKMGSGKPNIPVLIENLDWLRRAMTQKTAGQQAYAKSNDVDWDELPTRLNIIVIETMQLYLSGRLIEAENSSAIDDDVKKYCDYLKSETYDFCNRIENGEVNE